jgi:hypothetical protein
MQSCVNASSAAAACFDSWTLLLRTVLAWLLQVEAERREVETEEHLKLMADKETVSCSWFSCFPMQLC